MAEELKEFFKALALLLAGGSMSFFVQNYRRPQTLSDDHNKSQASVNQINADTIEQLSKQVNELIRRDEEKEKRIDHLEQELKKYVNAYARAIRYINEKLPGVIIPNFLETNPVTPTMKK